MLIFTKHSKSSIKDDAKLLYDFYKTKHSNTGNNIILDCLFFNLHTPFFKLYTIRQMQILNYTTHIQRYIKENYLLAIGSFAKRLRQNPSFDELAIAIL